MRGFNELKETLHNNRVNWILDVARQEMGLSNGHDLRHSELCWWAFMRNMMHPDAGRSLPYINKIIR